MYTYLLIAVVAVFLSIVYKTYKQFEKMDQTMARSDKTIEEGADELRRRLKEARKNTP